MMNKAEKYYLNSTPELQSLLYDLDLMPEQLREGTVDWARMIILIHWHRDVLRKSDDALP